MTSPSATQDSYPYQNEPIWSRSEKLVARTAFDAALGRELHEVIQKAKKMASQIQQSSDLWDLEHYLTERRKEIDRKYDYRYSQLTHVFGRLLYEERLREEELRGLREDKLKPIRSFAKFLAEDAA
jgi:Photoprotection regulator fluorescence recovery protein